MSGHDRSAALEVCRVRLATFATWPKCMVMPSKENLAQAGFWYTGISDRVICFACKLKLHDWRPWNDPYHDHLRMSPQCSYMRITYCRDLPVVLPADEDTVDLTKPGSVRA